LATGVRASRARQTPSWPGGDQILGIAQLSLAMLGGGRALLVGFDEFSSIRSAKLLVRAAESEAFTLMADAPFFQVRNYDETLPFYLG